MPKTKNEKNGKYMNGNKQTPTDAGTTKLNAERPNFYADQNGPIKRK